MPTPLVIAHRGGPGSPEPSLPENTLSAFERALSDGADALECDVQLTRDGVLAVHHDFQSQQAGGKVPVPDLDFATLTRERAGGGRDPRAVPRLEEVVEVARRAGRPLYVEVKDAKEYHDRGLDIEGLVLRALDRTGFLKDCVIQSFDLGSLQKLAALDGAARLLRLYSHTDEIDLSLLPGQVAIVSPPIGRVVAELGQLASRVRATGRLLVAWREVTLTELKPALRVLAEVGIDGVMVDDVPSAVEALRGG